MSHFQIPDHIFTGANALQEAAPYFSRLGRKAFIVTGKHVGKSEGAQRLKNTLEEEGIEYTVFDGITGEPEDSMISEGLKKYKESGCDFFIGFGGGSAMDSAKAIAALSVLGGEIQECMGKSMEGDFPPVAAIPTTAGTGSEATKFTVITDSRNGVKMLLSGESLIPTLAILEPAFTIDMPESVTAYTGMDALTHAVEAFTSKKASVLTDVQALSAVNRIMTYLPRAYKDGTDEEARKQMQLAALEAGICINNSSVTLVHGMSRPVGALFHVPHGLSNAMLINDCLSFALDGALGRFAALGRSTKAADEKSSDLKAAEAFLDQIKELCSICEIPSLREYGIEKSSFLAVTEKMARDAIASGSCGNTRKTVTQKDCEDIYKKVIEN